MAAQTKLALVNPAQAAHLLLQYRPSLQSTVDSSLEKLMDIANAYPQRSGLPGSHQENFEDRLFLWTSETADLDLADKNDAAIVEILSGSLQELLSDILICPLSQTTNRNPVCFHGYVVDRNALAYRQEFGGHPITNPNDYPSHPFARDIVAWVRELLDKVTLPDPASPQRDLLETLLALDPDRPQNLSSQLARVPQAGDAALITAMFARMMASRAVASNALMLSTQSIRQRIEQVEARADEDRERFKHCIDMLRAAFAAHQERVKQKFASAADAQKKEVKILKDGMAEQARVYTEVHAVNQRTQGILETRLEHAIAREHHLEGQVEGLQQAHKDDHARIDSLEAALRAARSENSKNRKEAKKAGRGCTIQ